MKHIVPKSLLILLTTILLSSCKSSKSTLSTTNKIASDQVKSNNKKSATFTSLLDSDNLTGAENVKAYLNYLIGKRVGIVTNQTGIVTKSSNPLNDLQRKNNLNENIIDFLLEKKINIKTIYAPEHGFRGTADAGELVKDGKDITTGLPIMSLYGDNKKPKDEQLAGIDIMIFDLQDVGARFYTYISTLHYIMEACAENNIEVLVLDRPNPNGAIVDGPILEKDYSSFVGMHQIPVLHGMTIGEYAKMINGEKWLKNELQCDLKIIPCVNYRREMAYSLPVKPSPNLPNDQAINLYASICLFEGTNVSSGRGTEKQFQIYGSPSLPQSNFSFTPVPNYGSKEPMNKNQMCYGEDLSMLAKVTKLEIKWLIKAYNSTSDKSKFFNPFFTKLAGTKKLQEQIEAGVSENDIRKSWEKGIKEFKETRKKYLIYN